jgi:hypothetical protein
MIWSSPIHIRYCGWMWKVAEIEARVVRTK